MKIKSTIGIILLAMPFAALSYTNTFTRSLFSGMQGDDVFVLQQFLNKNPETIVSQFGAGSPGNETTYFGPATKKAVIKFQERYKDDVLLPLGLSFGTGYFGEMSREKANALYNDLRIEDKNAPPAAVASSSTQTKGTVVLMFPSQYSGPQGTMITLTGSGFTSTDNIIYFGKDAVTGAVSWNGQSISFKVPNIPKGIYPLSVVNVRGKSNSGNFFVVTDGITPEPMITSVSPNKIIQGGIVSVRGTGFMASGNMVQYGIGIFKNLSSPDGTSLSFTVPTNIIKKSTSNSLNESGLPLWVFVVNENGVSNGKSFTLEI